MTNHHDDFTADGPDVPPVTPKRKRRSPNSAALATAMADLMAEHDRKKAERLAAGDAAPPRLFINDLGRAPRKPTLAGFITSEERAKAAREERERVRKIEERQYRRERYAREKALKRGDPNPRLPPVSPAGRRREAERVARELERERWLALVAECTSGGREA
ncbi:MAG: hypothetical protein AB7U95_25125 [Reyranella sp.]